MRPAYLLFLVVVFTSCAPKTRDIKETNALQPDEAIAIGRIRIKYNGEDFNESCFVCINGTGTGKCGNLDKTGYLFRTVKAGPVEVSGFFTRPHALHSSYHYYFKGVSFNTVPGTVNYFGNLDVDWKAGEGLKVTQFLGLAGVAIDQSSNDGVLTYVVKDESKEVIREYAKEAGIRESSVKIQKTLIQPPSFGTPQNPVKTK